MNVKKLAESRCNLQFHVGKVDTCMVWKSFRGDIQRYGGLPAATLYQKTYGSDKWVVESHVWKYRGKYHRDDDLPAVRIMTPQGVTLMVCTIHLPCGTGTGNSTGIYTPPYMSVTGTPMVLSVNDQTISYTAYLRPLIVT